MALARLGLTIGAGYGLVWAFSSPAPYWAQEPLTHPPSIDLSGIELPDLRIGLPEMGRSPSARAALSEDPLETAVSELAASDRVAPPFDGLVLPDAALVLARSAQPMRLEPARSEDGGWVIGYGRLLAERPLRAISPEEAEGMLREDLDRAADAVRRVVFIPLNDNEFGALAEFARSVGLENFENTLVVAMLNAGEREAAADAILLWTRTRVDGVLVESGDLVAQRRRTRALFLADTPGSGA
jgi:lysozyme